MDNNELGRPGGLSPEVEPCGLDGFATSIPDAEWARVKISTRREIIRGVAKAWRAQYGYGHYLADSHKQSIQRKLDALNLDSCTAEDVAEAIGNHSWTDNLCDLCHDDAEVVAVIGDEPEYEARWQSICLPCLVNLGKWAAQGAEARQGGDACGSIHDGPVGETDAPKSSPLSPKGIQ